MDVDAIDRVVAQKGQGSTEGKERGDGLPEGRSGSRQSLAIVPTHRVTPVRSADYGPRPGRLQASAVAPWNRGHRAQRQLGYVS
jgi:hypothetical protein